MTVILRVPFPVVCAVLLAAAARAETEVPLLTGRVVDNAGLFSAESAGALTARLKEIEDSTSDQIAVLTIPSLEGDPIESYAIRVAESWKLGRADRDNGVLLVVVRDDRKVRIEVGRGLEGDLPDITCGRIIRNIMIPRFREGEYDGGVRAGVEAIGSALRGTFTPPPEPEETADIGARILAGGIFTVVVGLFTLFALFARGGQAWFLYLFLLPFWFVFPTAILGFLPGVVLFSCYAVALPLLRLWFSRSAGGKSIHTKLSSLPFIAAASSGGFTHGGGSSWSSGVSSISGGAGGFSGGGASGSW